MGTGEKGNFEKYKEQKGTIDKEDYLNILARARDVVRAGSAPMSQALSIAKYAGITLQNVSIGSDVVTLYCLMRMDKKPKEKDGGFHYTQMSDQRLFAEVLQILGDTDSFSKLTGAYPNISFG